MRPLILAVLLTVGSLVPTGVVWAQPQPLQVALRAAAGGKVVLTVGDLQGQGLPAPALATLSFLVRWHKGDVDAATPLTTSGFTTSVALYKLQLPVSGLVLAQVAEHAAHITVQRCQTVGPTPVVCPFTVNLVKGPDAWKVVRVSVP
jgi:hypothetical protein